LPLSRWLGKRWKEGGGLQEKGVLFSVNLGKKEGNKEGKEGKSASITYSIFSPLQFHKRRHEKKKKREEGG